MISLFSVIFHLFVSYFPFFSLLLFLLFYVLDVNASDLWFDSVLFFFFGFRVWISLLNIKRFDSFKNKSNLVCLSHFSCSIISDPIWKISSICCHINFFLEQTKNRWSITKIMCSIRCVVFCRIWIHSISHPFHLIWPVPFFINRIFAIGGNSNIEH